MNIKTLKPGLVALNNVQPGNGSGLFLQQFIYNVNSNGSKTTKVIKRLYSSAAQ